MSPSFTTQTPNLVETGPVTEIQLLITRELESQLRESEEKVPDPVKMNAMIDTGATGTVIREGFTDKLNLNPVGISYINTPSTENFKCYNYNVRLLFPNRTSIDGITVIQAPLKGQHIDCLIGRDILSNAVFVYIGYTNQFTLSF